MQSDILLHPTQGISIQYLHRDPYQCDHTISNLGALPTPDINTSIIVFADNIILVSPTLNQIQRMIDIVVKHGQSMSFCHFGHYILRQKCTKKQVQALGGGLGSLPILE